MEKLVDISKLDLNLLIVLKTLIHEKHISNTGLTLNMSQPSVSRALGKLRVLFDDPLLVRIAGQYELTEKAKSLEVELTHVLAMVEGILNKQTFTPLTSRATLKLFGLPPQMSVFIEPLIGEIRRQAPHLTLDIDSTPKPQFNGLINGDVHFVVSGHSPQNADDKIHRLPLFQRNFVLLMAQTHKLATKEVTIEKLKDCHFGQISTQGESVLPIAGRLENLGISNISTPIKLKHFYNIGGLVEKADIIFYLPEHLAEDIAKTHNVAIRKVPASLESDYSQVYLYWHQRFHEDPLCLWFRKLVKSRFQYCNTQYAYGA
ncbi:LysR family transcriptional regulator [Alteromonas australica]|uniref:LysR family transcriptional regulator n=1 Tax=Alteromonas australica TaxID=589873 RepID=UPI0035C7AAE6